MRRVFAPLVPLSKGRVGQVWHEQLTTLRLLRNWASARASVAPAIGRTLLVLKTRAHVHALVAFPRHLTPEGWRDTFGRGRMDIGGCSPTAHRWSSRD